eukprot:8088265-Pyramimonas_sp.AAC.1
MASSSCCGNTSATGASQPFPTLGPATMDGPLLNGRNFDLPRCLVTPHSQRRTRPSSCPHTLS